MGMDSSFHQPAVLVGEKSGEQVMLDASRMSELGGVKAERAAPDADVV